MATNWKRAPFAAWLTLALLPAGIAQSKENEKEKVSMAAARRAALALENGKVKSSELEKEKGMQIYSFDIQMPDGLHEVNIDAVTGKVVEDTIENAQDEAAEAVQGKAAKAKAEKKGKPSPATDAHPQ
jgi:isopentenyldiphosphate isomerase